MKHQKEMQIAVALEKSVSGLGQEPQKCPMSNDQLQPSQGHKNVSKNSDRRADKSAPSIVDPAVSANNKEPSGTLKQVV